jgi:hypothetical protein
MSWRHHGFGFGRGWYRHGWYGGGRYRDNWYGDSWYGDDDWYPRRRWDSWDDCDY